MSSYALISTTGRIASGQAEFVAVPRGGGQGRPALIALHADQQVAYQKWNNTYLPKEFALLDRIARAGVVVVSADLDDDYSNSGWGNPTVQSRISACVTLAASYGAHASRYSLWGVSMGSTTAMIQASVDASNVAAMVVGMPLPDLEGLRTVTGNPVQAQINTAWGTATGSTSPPIQQGGVDITPLKSTREAAIAGIPKQVYYSSGDTTVMAFSTQLTAWATAVGATLVECGSQGHGDAQVGDYPAATITKFLVNAT